MEKAIKKKKLKVSDGNIMTTHKGADRIYFTIAFIIFAVHCLSLVIPYVWMILSSLKEANEYNLGESLLALPKGFDIQNYANALENLYDPVTNTTFFGMIGNSIWYTFLQAGLACFMPCLTGYVMSKYRFKGREFIYAVVIFSMTVPIVGSGASTMKLFHTLNLYDTPVRLFVGGLSGFGGTFIVYYGFFKGVSWSYAEAAQIDGGGPYTILFRIMLPQALPIMMTYFLTGAIGAWNEYESIILYMPSYPTLAVGLFTYRDYARSDMPTYYAGLVISMIPTLVVFATFSSKIMTSVSIGGLKG